jgi:Ser/Thr protein kinase RdoA (MazF antagonist)
VGPIPGIGGPFDSAADFFKAWATHAKFPYKEKTVRERTPADLVDDILKSIQNFRLQLVDFAQRHCFQSRPFPIFHTDLYKSNILLDSEYNIQGVIDWENAIVAPWEMVEFIKDLAIVPPVIDGPVYHEEDSDREVLADRRKYIEAVQEIEKRQQLDNKLSTVLSNWNTQNLAHALWLYLDGKIGYYTMY